MIILAVDTTTPNGSVALLEDRRLAAEINSTGPLNHSQRLLPAVHFVLETQRLEIADIDAFAVAAGPGSFTGIRVGMSTVKAFACASGKSIAPVSALAALALKLRSSRPRLLCPLMDAKKGELYTSLFEYRDHKLHELIPQGSYRADRFLSLCPSHRVIHFIGTGVPLYKKKINDYLGDRVRFSHRSLYTAFEVGLMGFDMIQAGEGRSHLEVEPLYFRKSQAEEGH